MASRAPTCVKSHVRGALISGSVNLRALGSSNQRYGRRSRALFSTSITTAPPPMVAPLLPPPRQQRQQHQTHRSGWLVTSRDNPVCRGFRCFSSTPTAMATTPAAAPAAPAVATSPPSFRPPAVCALPPSATERAHGRHHRHHHHHHRPLQQPFCTSSNSSGGGVSSGKLGDIKVTHVDAAAGGGSDDDDGREMMPEEDRQPVGAASAAQGSGGEPDTVRFLDVPGSEQTREEKMTIVFTCTVRERENEMKGGRRPSHIVHAV